jgi:pimeloyl-ACP methyl ester carboxylesterase
MSETPVIEPEPRGRVDRSVIAVGDAQIECFIHGDGPAIVMLPGGSLAVGYLADLADELAAAGFRAIRLNPRGAGASTGPMDGLTLHDYAADVAGVIEALGLGRAFVLGHAFGNRVARAVAADHPTLTQGVILISAGGKVAPSAEGQAALATIFTPTATEAEVLGAMHRMVGDPANAASVWERFKDDRAPASAGAQLAAARATPVEDWWSPPGDAPYLVIQGLKDEAAPAANGHLLKEELGDRVTVVDIAGAGHLQPLEAPRPVADAIIAFAR